jgi:hypothetical protein
MLKKTVFFFMMIVFAGLSFGQENSRPPDNKELITKARSFYVVSDTVYMKRERLESSLLGSAEFKAWDLQVSNNERRADMLINVKRIPFTNHFSYTVTDRATDTVVMAGVVDSLAGTVYWLIADEIVHKMKALRGDPPPQRL